MSFKLVRIIVTLLPLGHLRSLQCPTGRNEAGDTVPDALIMEMQQTARIVAFPNSRRGPHGPGKACLSTGFDTTASEAVAILGSSNKNRIVFRADIAGIGN